MELDADANELFVADGYGNRRVIVFDAATGAYKRHWGAYGKKPEDGNFPNYNPESAHFGMPVHCVRMTKDNLVYVCDRMNNACRSSTRRASSEAVRLRRRHARLRLNVGSGAVRGRGAALPADCRWNQQRSAHCRARDRRKDRIVRPPRTPGRRLPLGTQHCDRLRRIGCTPARLTPANGATIPPRAVVLRRWRGQMRLAGWLRVDFGIGFSRRSLNLYGQYRENDRNRLIAIYTQEPLLNGVSEKSQSTGATAASNSKFRVEVTPCEFSTPCCASATCAPSISTPE